MKQRVNWVSFLTIAVLTQLAGVLGSLFSGNLSQAYGAYEKPPLSPPGWLFGIVWPILYLLMSIAFYLVSQQEPKTPAHKTASVLYWAQLFVNFLWPIVFFRLEWYWISVGIIVLLDILVVLTSLRFFKIKKTAAYLMLPYLLWILFATYLNIGIALLNGR